MLNKILLFALLPVMALLFASCGSNNKSPSVETPSVETPIQQDNIIQLSDQEFNLFKSSALDSSIKTCLDSLNSSNVDLPEQVFKDYCLKASECFFDEINKQDLEDVFNEVGITKTEAISQISEDKAVDLIWEAAGGQKTIDRCAEENAPTR
jgi:hypothetical protein